MSDAISITVTGEAEVARMLNRLSDAVRGQAIGRMLVAAALPVQNEWKRIAPVKTGTYRRSITTGEPDIGAMEIRVGSNAPYGRRLEYGFSGTDRLGRTYNQPAGGYARRALDTSRGDVHRAAADALRDLVTAAVR